MGEKRRVENPSQGLGHEVGMEPLPLVRGTFHQSWQRVMVPYGPHYTLGCMYKVCKGQVRRKSSIQLSKTERRKGQRVRFDRSQRRQQAWTLSLVSGPRHRANQWRSEVS